MTTSPPTITTGDSSPQLIKSKNTSLPQAGFLRLSQIIGSPKADIPALIPVSKSSWWKGVKEGRFPPSVKLGPRTTVWRAADIYKLIEGNGEVQP